MNMNELYESNRFIRHFNDLQELSEMHNLDAFVDYKPIIKKKLFQKVVEPENRFKEIITERVNKFISKEFGIDRKGEDADYIEASTLSFLQLWDFCQFVRYAEKVLFFKNDKESPIYVDSKLEDLDSRKFMVKSDNEVEIEVILEKQAAPGQTLRIIKLNITRKYGKMMNNQYIIVNDNTDKLDISDNVLIFNINLLIYKCVVNTYISIIEKFLKNIEGSLRWKTTDLITYKLDKLEDIL